MIFCCLASWPHLLLILSTTSMPKMTSPIVAKPCLSKLLLLSPRLMNSCVVLVPGPAVAKETVPLTFDPTTGSSFNSFSLHSASIAGSPWRRRKHEGRVSNLICIHRDGHARIYALPQLAYTDTKLNNEARHDAEELAIGEKVRLNEILFVGVIENDISETSEQIWKHFDEHT